MWGNPPPSGWIFFRLRDNSSITWWNFIKRGQKVKLDVKINWLDFEWDCVAGGGGGLMWGNPPPPPSGWIFFRLRDNSSITWWNSIRLGRKVKYDVAINWLDFEWDCIAGRGGGWEPPPPPPPSDFVYLRDNSSITSWNFIRLGGKVKYNVAINWLDFEWDCIAGVGGGGGESPPPSHPPLSDFFSSFTR